MKKIKEFCRYSVTIAVGYVIGLFSILLDSLDAIADIIGSPDLKQSISDMFGGDPKVVAKFMLGVTVIMMLARLRSLRRTNGDHQ